MDGFQKIDLQPQDGKKSKKRGVGRGPFTFNLGKNSLRIGIVLIVLAVLSVFTIVLPAQKTYKSARETYQSAKLVAAYVKNQNIQQAEQELKHTKEFMAKTQKDLNSLSFLQFIPIAGWYYSDADHLVKAGIHGIETGEILLSTLTPYADVLGLKGQGSFVGGTAEERIKTAVLTMGKVTPKISELSKSLVAVREEVDKVSPNHYPAFLFGKKVHDQILQLRDLTDQGVTFVDEAQPLIKVLPSLLGETKEKKYLILFQNDKELRATGGFITAFAIFRIDKGVIHVDRSDDIYTLDNSIPNKPTAPEPILKYLPKLSTLNLRDSNLSPDFIESMKTFRTLYNRAGQKVEVDGIIALDTHVLVSVLKILDDQVTAGGINFTTKNDPRCDCPQVIYVLEDNISRPVNYVRTGRKDLLGILLYALMEKALKSSPKLYWGPLFQDLITQVQQKHILFDLNDKNAQSGIEALNAAGRIREFNGDYLHINDVNFAGAKSNLFTDQAVEVAYSVKNGQIEKTLTINYKNTHAPSDCNLERGGLCLNAELRDWIRIYVPKGSKLISSKGSEVKVDTNEDLGKTVFEGFITVRPLGKTTYTLTYLLPFKVEKGSLPVLIQKQPGTGGNEYTIKVNNRTVDKFPLLTDKELNLKM
ncbi:MAG: DUF4012 domain-containing protein [Candidatus Levybacteria bacterium]|nr:DUF4012 domain-containing protein [Candidatus Levybacteria bacterium]